MRNAWLLAVVACAGLLSGCVERRYVIMSDPPGAVVYRNGQMLGAAPVDDFFTYYGKYDFTLVKDNYQTLKVKQDIQPPWYEWWPLDFVSENIWPGHLVDRHEYHYQLQPVQAARTDELLNQSEQMRSRGHSIAPPPEAQAPPVPARAIPGQPGTVPAPPGPVVRVQPAPAPLPPPAAPGNVSIGPLSQPLPGPGSPPSPQP